MANTRLGLRQFIETVQQELLEYQQNEKSIERPELENIEMDVCVGVTVDDDGKTAISVAQSGTDATTDQLHRIKLRFKAPSHTSAKPADLTATVDVGLDSVSVGGPMYLDLDDILPGGHVFELPDQQQESLHKVWIIGGPTGSTEVDLADIAELSKSLQDHIGSDHR